MRYFTYVKSRHNCWSTLLDRLDENCVHRLLDGRTAVAALFWRVDDEVAEGEAEAIILPLDPEVARAGAGMGGKAGRASHPVTALSPGHTSAACTHCSTERNASSSCEKFIILFLHKFLIMVLDYFVLKLLPSFE